MPASFALRGPRRLDLTQVTPVGGRTPMRVLIDPYLESQHYGSANV
jgi:hypothetical protein